MSRRLAAVPTEVPSVHLQNIIVTTTITCQIFFVLLVNILAQGVARNSRCSNTVSSVRQPQFDTALPCMQLQLFGIGLLELFVAAFPSGLHIFLLKPTAIGTLASIHAVSSRLASIFASQVDFSTWQHTPCCQWRTHHIQSCVAMLKLFSENYIKTRSWNSPNYDFMAI
jgi:hypothetical protein